MQNLCIQEDPCQSFGCHGRTDFDDAKQIQVQQNYIQKLKLQRQKIQSLKHQFQGMKDQLVDKNLQIARLHSRVQLFQPFKSSFQQLTQKHQRLLFQFKKLLQTKKQLEDSLDQYQSQQYPQKIAKFRDLVTQAQSQKSLLALRVAKVQSDNQRLKQQCRQFESKCLSKNQSLKIRFESLKKELQRVSGQNDQLRDQNDTIKNQLQYCQSDIKGLTDKLKLLSQQLQSAKCLIQKKQTVICLVKDELEQFKLNHHKQISIYSTKIERLNFDIKRANSTISQLGFKNQQLQTRNHDISASLERAAQDRVKLEVQNKYSFLSENQQEQDKQDKYRQLKKTALRREKQLKKVCESKEVDRRQRNDLLNKRIFSQQQKAAQLQLMDTLLKQINQKYIKKHFY